MRTRGIVAIVGFALLGLANTAVASADAGGNPPEAPTVTGPVTGGNGISLAVAGLGASHGTYEAAEFFLEGSATSYAADGQLGSNGRWNAEPADTAPYKTRVVVYRPSSAEDFNGTVFVEWLNVTAGADTGPDWIAAHTQLIRMGAAWVGVSAQEQGVQGSDDSPGGVKNGDPARYGTLTHPGDDYSFDIYSQAGVAAHNETEPAILGDLQVERVIATGESQSAYRMTTYVNAVDPLVQVYDGFFIHSRGGSASGLDETEVPDVVRIRRDARVPVMTFETETDLIGLGYVPSRQRDSKGFRLWEVAGTSHADAYTLVGFGDDDSGTAEQTMLDPSKANGGALGCAEFVNAGAAFAVQNAAMFHLDRWVEDGTLPPRAPRIKVDGDQIVRDDHGNAIGGIRTPIVDVPIAANDGDENSGGRLCGLFGHIKPFDAATLAALYPTHDDYVSKFNASADKAVEDGFWIETDAEQYKAAAAALPIPA